MFEVVLTQELSLPSNGLVRLQEIVPLPRFVKLEHYPFAVTNTPNNEDDCFYHYHFLSQIAHRKILTRAKETIYDLRKVFQRHKLDEV